ncbi:hypothetical protein CPLU01_07022 [Colletotrichum plurivorum]|uniref:Uncharacterized protein n=1 Tax=Colletotrichum plurivorum TaxID=2175906 RepID=A0A8H6KGA2_9PEZI|nr:hypothetical protein CPLU01_07022 [Colletotrichum plurivorum]
MPARCSCTRLARLPIAAKSSINLTRPFSTTSVALNVPPESPAWIQVPQPPQSQASEVKLPKVKGTIPVPRDPFPAKDADRKIRPEYIEATMPKASNEASQRPVEPGSREEHRRRMAESRRENLEAALQGLYQRKQQRVEATTAASARRLRDHQRAANAPERQDDVLTRSSIISTLAKTQTVQADPLRYERAAESKARTAAIAQQKSEARQDALMEMYINASEFIVSEEELESEVDRLFAEDYWKRQGKSMAHDSDNAWDVWGQPPTLQNMMDEMLRKRESAINFQQSEQDRTVKRQKVIAEELTGGKMQ